MKTLLLCTLLLSSTFILSQRNSFSSSRDWQRNKHEIYFALGATQFLGDLGGLSKEGTQKSLVDIDWPKSRMGGAFGYRLRLHPRWATSTQLYFGMVSGDDAQTNEVIRRSRNLSFRSPILELSQRIEFIIYANEQPNGRKTKSNIFYVMSGISGFFFNPQTQINGAWTNLRELRTEGQGLPGGAEEYSRLNIAIPMGVGYRFALNDDWRLGVEISYNKTFTDYIDDVSTDYYDPEILADKIGSKAVYAANPSIENHTWFEKGQQRGNPDDNDAYLFANITLTRNITGKSKGISRSRRLGRTRF